jgi:outer membrane lipoprotein-sorting protein
LPAKDDYPTYKTVIYIDVDRLVPLCIEGFDWDNNLQCRYIYQDVKFNVGLTQDDFLPETNEMVVK